jgi:multidrug efflux pump
MAKEGLSPREATRKAMREITGAVIGITLVLAAVIIPMGLAGGSVGAIYRQFTLSMAVSILFAAFLALSLTPALCATVLKPAGLGRHGTLRILRWFPRAFARLTCSYEAWTIRLVRRTGAMMLLYGIIVAVLGYAFVRLPSAFVPDEDQGSFLTTFSLPADATAERTRDIVSLFESHIAGRSAVENNLSIAGFGFGGAGQNTAFAFTTLKDWSNRDGHTVDEEVQSATAAMAKAPEGVVMSLKPAAIEGLGETSEFALRLEDRGNHGHAALVRAQAKLLALAAQSRLVAGVRAEGLPNGPSVRLNIDRHKAETLGVSLEAISVALTTAIASTHVNDFPNAGRLQQVIVQADAPTRMQVEDVLSLYVRNNAGAMVSLSEVITPAWETSPLQLIRYNGFPALRIAGSAAPHVSSGAAMAEMERLAAQLPNGFTVEWTGQSFEEQQAGVQAPVVLALSALVIFLVLAALYENWSGSHRGRLAAAAVGSDDIARIRSGRHSLDAGTRRRPRGPAGHRHRRLWWNDIGDRARADLRAGAPHLRHKVWSQRGPTVRPANACEVRRVAVT